MYTNKVPTRAEQFPFVNAIIKPKLLTIGIVAAALAVVGFLSPKVFGADSIWRFVIALALGSFAGFAYAQLRTLWNLFKGSEFFYIHSLEDVEKARRNLQKKANQSFLWRLVNSYPIQLGFADLVCGNRITNFTVSDGTGRDRGSVVIDIKWTATNFAYPTLYLYRDEGEVWESTAPIVEKPTAVKLDFRERGESAHVVDAAAENGKTYTYYAWIAVDFYSYLALSFVKHQHTARYAETKQEFVERKLSNHEVEERLKKLREKPGNKFAEISQRIKARKDQGAEEKELRAHFAREMAALDMDEYEKEIFEKGLLKELVHAGILRPRYPH